ncbi:hypothetical protein F2Q69_00056089 [Brassica cretica]|uniref:Uncharacterized protein n=1 Tax=Brassica cretica TaxID=69181 RepID=A0A8S9N9Q4_BRACR|nr:hypothetical protein F2Q69_00056089 [Brassica cretica]
MIPSQETEDPQEAGQVPTRHGRGTPQDLETEANKRLKGSQEGSAAEQRARRR